MNNRKDLAIFDLYPCLNDNTSTTSSGGAYYYQGIWALKKIMKSNIKKHYDVGSQKDFVIYLTAITEVAFIDIRPIVYPLDNLEVISGSILDLPFENNSIESLSSMHVVEHIGLGRYGDPLDADGSIKACRELARVLKEDGFLYFSVPLARKSKVCFNAHRLFTVDEILSFFNHLELLELSGIDDAGYFHKNINKKIFDHSEFACGLFVFTKKK